MSYYTNVHVDLSDFNLKLNMNDDELNDLINTTDKEITKLDNELKNIWILITALCVATPKDIYILNSEHDESSRFIIDELNIYVNDKHEYLDELLKSLCFCTLMIKYSDNITRC